EGGEAPRKLVAGCRVRRVDDEIAEALLDRSLETKRFEPSRRRGAGGCLPFSDFVTVQQEDASGMCADTCPRELSRDRQARKARATNHGIVVPVEPGAVGRSFGSSLRHLYGG